MPSVVVDPQSQSLQNRFALIQTPRKSRKRFPAGNVTEVEDEAAARAGENPQLNLYPAIVYGPSKSSEGLMIYYLVRWLS